MKKGLFAALSLLAVLTAPQSHAQCLSISPGKIVINHRQGALYGGNFVARVACSWGAPVLVYWRGGGMCVGRSFYGRNFAGKPFSCRVLSVRFR